MVTNIDTNFARLLQTLDARGLRENTLVIFLTDNGAQQSRFNAGFRGRKSWTYEGGIRVPCFMQWPAVIRPGRTVDRIAAHIDLHATVIELAMATSPRDRPLDGISLAPLLRDVHQSWPDRSLFFQVHRGLKPQAYQNCAVVTQQYKLVGHPGTFKKEDLPVTDPPLLELYDLLTDPAESQDLSVSHPDVVARLRKEYDDWFTSVRSSREFTPGLIRVDTQVESPFHLCRYQDGIWKAGRSTGWNVEIVRSGRYRVAIRRERSEAGELHVSWANVRQTSQLSAGKTSAEFDLPAGTGILDVWFQKANDKRRYDGDNSVWGDIDITAAN